MRTIIARIRYWLCRLLLARPRIHHVEPWTESFDAELRFIMALNAQEMQMDDLESRAEPLSRLDRVTQYYSGYTN